MSRDPQDDAEVRAALDEWLRDKPEAAIIVAAVDRGEDDELDISMRFSRTTPFQLIGLIQALLQQAIENGSHQPGADQSPELDALREVLAFLEGGPSLSKVGHG